MNKIVLFFSCALLVCSQLAHAGLIIEGGINGNTGSGSTSIDVGINGGGTSSGNGVGVIINGQSGGSQELDSSASELQKTIYASICTSAFMKKYASICR